MCWPLTNACFPNMPVACSAGGLSWSPRLKGLISKVFFKWSFVTVPFRWDALMFFWGRGLPALEYPVSWTITLVVIVLRKASDILLQRDPFWCPFRSGSFALWFSIWIHTGWGIPSWMSSFWGRLSLRVDPSSLEGARGSLVYSRNS